MPTFNKNIVENGLSGEGDAFLLSPLDPLVNLSLFAVFLKKMVLDSTPCYMNLVANNNLRKSEANLTGKLAKETSQQVWIRPMYNASRE